MKKINIDQICSIESVLKERNSWYVYKKEIKFLGIKLRKEGFYIYDEFIRTEKISENIYLLIEDNKVYLKPHIIMKMSNGELDRKFFETEEDLNVFVYNLTNRNNWIKIKD